MVKNTAGLKKKGDYYRVKYLNKRGVVLNKWVSAKNLKKYDAVYFHHKHHNITVFAPKLKLGKHPKIEVKIPLGQKPVKLTVHIKITYDKHTSNKYLDKDRELDMDAKITTECLHSEIPQKTRELEKRLKEKLGMAFFENDHPAKLFYEPFYESGSVVKELDDETIDRDVEADVNYRYTKKGAYKNLGL